MNKKQRNEDEIDFSIYLEALNEEENDDKRQDITPDEENISTAEQEQIFEDISDGSSDENSDEKSDDTEKEKLPLSSRIKNWWARRGKAQKVIIIIVAVILILAIIAGVFVWSKLSLIKRDDFDGDEGITYEDINIEDMDSITDATSLNDYLKKWATNGGKKMSASYVKNVLLVGQRDGLTDSMMLISVNEKAKTVSMVSFYRDSWTYISPNGKKESFGKLNWAYGKGGVKCLVETIENDYKIKIDDYVMVDTDSFPLLIDALGGVDVNVTEKEATYLNNTWREWTFTGNPVSFKAGMNHLNGEKALMFCRIRKLDSDVGRTERQRRVISAVMTSFKDAGVSKVNNAINTLLPNVKTSMSNSEMLSFASKAVSNGWLKYPISQETMPTESTGKIGTAGNGQSVWLIDYEAAAHELQILLYGKSNINLSEERSSPISLKSTASQPQGNSYSYTGSATKKSNYSQNVKLAPSTEPPTEAPSESTDTTATSDTSQPTESATLPQAPGETKPEEKVEQN